MLQMVMCLAEVRRRKAVLVAEGTGENLTAVEARGEGYLLDAIIGFCQ